MIRKQCQLLTLLTLCSCLQAQESVRQEVMRRQKENGLALMSFYSGQLGTVDVGNRSIGFRDANVINGVHIAGGAVSPDGQFIAFSLSSSHAYGGHLGVSRLDGSGLREYPGVVSPSSFCWSNDNSKLALNAAVRRQLHGELLIVALDSKVTQEVEAGGYVTSQCWSPDNRQVIYGLGQSMRLYDLEEKRSRDIVKGEDPTWSPDGNWIAFHNNNVYYAIRPSGVDPKELFKQKGIRTGLWWSPDSRVVAYMCIGGKYDPNRDFDFLPRQLRVRRLVDGSDDFVLVEPDVAFVPSYQWILPRKHKP